MTEASASSSRCLIGLCVASAMLAACVGGPTTQVEVRDEDSPSTSVLVTPIPTTAIPITTATTAISTTAETVAAVIVNVTGPVDGSSLVIEIAVESRVNDVTQAELASFVFETLADDRGWVASGFQFVESPSSGLRVVLAEGAEVDDLCLPLQTGGTVSCQNGATVALNATRWREATESWDSTVLEYRTYLVNHEVGHLIGQRHPTPRCPTPGAPAAVMEQQTKSLEGCTGNGWPRAWELDYARSRPATIGPDPSWAPDPVPPNLE